MRWLAPRWFTAYAAYVPRGVRRLLDLGWAYVWWPLRFRVQMNPRTITLGLLVGYWLSVAWARLGR